MDLTYAEGRKIPFLSEAHIRTDWLATFPYQGPRQRIRYETEELSAVCPFSGLPDYGRLELDYVPRVRIVELKALKYYLVSLRQVGIFQEPLTARIHDDLMTLLEPHWLRVCTRYRTRGGIDAICTVSSDEADLHSRAASSSGSSAVRTTVPAAAVASVTASEAEVAPSVGGSASPLREKAGQVASASAASSDFHSRAASSSGSVPSGSSAVRTRVPAAAVASVTASEAEVAPSVGGSASPLREKAGQVASASAASSDFHSRAASSSGSVPSGSSAVRTTEPATVVASVTTSEAEVAPPVGGSASAASSTSAASSASPLRVVVNGAKGRMGRFCVRAVQADVALELVGVADVEDDLPALLRDTRAQVAIDFTTPAAAYANARAIIDGGVHPVIGTTGFTTAQLNELQARCAQAKLGGVIAPNFALGALLLMRFAAEAARFLPQAEIIELHHDGKAEAPSGTAIATARQMRSVMDASAMSASAMSASVVPAEARVPKVEANELAPGARGTDAWGVPIHAVRLPGHLAHQEVILAGPGESLRLRHDTVDRECFMPGVVLAVKRVLSRKTLALSLAPLLFEHDPNAA